MKKTLLINEIEVVITDDQSLLPGSSIDRQNEKINERISCDGTHKILCFGRTITDDLILRLARTVIRLDWYNKGKPRKVNHKNKQRILELLNKYKQ